MIDHDWGTGLVSDTAKDYQFLLEQNFIIFVENMPPLGIILNALTPVRKSVFKNGISQRVNSSVDVSIEWTGFIRPEFSGSNVEYTFKIRYRVKIFSKHEISQAAGSHIFQ